MTVEHEPACDLFAFVVRYLRCETCGGAFRRDKMRVLLYADQEWVLGASCPACGQERLVRAYDQAPYSRLYPGEPVVPGPITRDCVNEWTVFLDGFAGDMYDLLVQS